MARSDHETHCQWVHARIEAFLDGDLSAPDQSTVESHVAGCPLCAQELELARRITVSLHDLPQQECPQQVSETIMARAASSQLPHTRLWVKMQTLFRPASWRPAFVVAVTMLLIATIGVIGRMHQMSSQVSQAQLARAEREARWTLTYIGGIARRTGRTVRSELLGPHVIRPVTRAVEQSQGIDTIKEKREVRHEM